MAFYLMFLNLFPVMVASSWMERSDVNLSISSSSVIGFISSLRSMWPYSDR